MTEPTSHPAYAGPIGSPDDFAAAFSVSRETLDRLSTYEKLLRQWQETQNLVASSTLDAIWHRHFADSAQILALAPQARTWVDLGSGAGFPGLVVAILMAESIRDGVLSPLAGEGQGGGDGGPSNVATGPTPAPPRQRGGEAPPRLTLIESNARKCAFLREVVRETGIAEWLAVDILSTRIEAAATQANLPGADVVTARALAPLDRLLNLAAPLFAGSTVGLFLKGRSAADELDAAKNMWNLNAELVPSRTEPGAHIVVVRHLDARGKTKGPTP